MYKRLHILTIQKHKSAAQRCLIRRYSQEQKALAFVALLEHIVSNIVAGNCFT